MKVAILQPPYLAAAETIAWETEQLCLLEDSGCDLVVLPEYSNVTGIEEAAALREFAAGEGGHLSGGLRNLPGIPVARLPPEWLSPTEPDGFGTA